MKTYIHILILTLVFIAGGNNALAQDSFSSGPSSYSGYGWGSSSGDSFSSSGSYSGSGSSGQQPFSVSGSYDSSYYSNYTNSVINRAQNYIESSKTSSANTSIQKQIADLLAQIKKLQAQVAGRDTDDADDEDSEDKEDDTKVKYSSGVCSVLPNLGGFRKGVSHPGVKTLQKFLIEAKLLPADSETGYFGGATEAALKSWQKTHGVVTSGDADSTGFGVFGFKTRAAMARVCENRDADDVKAFKLSPERGKAPLTVEVASLPSEVVKKMTGCKFSQGFTGASGNGLTVTWGDGEVSPKAVAKGDSNYGDSCTTAVKKHTYKKPGTYTARIKSWHPGPADAPITDWEGVATVIVTADTSSTTNDDGVEVSKSTDAALKARSALAKKLDVFTGNIAVMKVVKMTWSNGCLDLAGTGEVCTEALVPGFKVTLEYDDEQYVAHTNKSGLVVRFEE